MFETTALHTVFGASIGILLSQSRIVEVATMADLGAPVLAFALFAVVAACADGCFVSVCEKKSPWLYCISAIVLAFAIAFIFQKDGGACNLATSNSLPSMSFCADFDPFIFLLSLIMVLWTIAALALATIRRMTE